MEAMTQHLELKYARADVKAFDQATGTFEALVSVFGNVDLGGDRVVKGAFAKTLQDWAAKAEPIPVIWSHEWDDPTSHIGVVIDAKETDQGLWVHAQLDVDANPKAAYVARLLKQRRVTQFSFGYYAKQYRDVTDNGQYVRELTEIELFEVGPTLLGMNPDTQLLQAASRTVDDAKAGRTISKKDERNLLKARDLIDQVLTAPTDSEAASTDPDAKSTDILEDAAPDAGTDTGAPAEDVSRDTPDNININNPELQYLLTRPKHTEENR